MHQHLTLPDGRRLAYVKHAGEGRGVIFLPGFKSDMTGAKAMALDAWCRARGVPYVRFDYTGHGQSSGRFEEGTNGQWLRDALDVFDALTHGSQIVVGSSMGGWLMLLLALARPDRVAALIGLAAAPDFTERLIWDAFSAAQKAQLMQDGQVALPNCYEDGTPYIITRALIEEGRDHLLLGREIPLHCSIRLLHGTGDTDVPWQLAQTLLERLAGEDVRLTLVKGAGHRLSAPEELGLVCEAVDEFHS